MSEVIREMEAPKSSWILDLGGGEDVGGYGDEIKVLHKKWVKGELHDEEKAKHKDRVVSLFNSLRAVHLAKSNPGRQVVLVDRFILSGMFPELRSALPNLHMIIVGEEAGHSLPFKDGSFKDIEMNFMFTPLTLEDLPKTFPAGMTPNEQMDAIGNFRPTELSQAPSWSQALRESARILSGGGTLTLSEKRDRIERMWPVLAKDPVLKEGEICAASTALQEMGYETIQLVRLDDLHQSPYAHRAREMVGYWKEKGDTQRAERFIPWSIILTKKQ